jgi:hypothetical protein
MTWRNVPKCYMNLPSTRSRGEMADTLALEASAQKAWGFKSLREHQLSHPSQ